MHDMAKTLCVLTICQTYILHLENAKDMPFGQVYNNTILFL